MSIQEIKQLCQGCKRSFKELEKVEINLTLKNVNQNIIKVISLNLASDIDGLLDGLFLGIDDDEYEDIMRSMINTIENKLSKELLIEMQ